MADTLTLADVYADVRKMYGVPDDAEWDYYVSHLCPHGTAYVMDTTVTSWARPRGRSAIARYLVLSPRKLTYSEQAAMVGEYFRKLRPSHV